MDDAIIVLGLATGAIKPKREAKWNPLDPIEAWLELGNANLWIRQASDPPFDRKSFLACRDLDHLKDRLSHGNWSLGQAFHLGDVCFIQQAGGGDEWLVIRRSLAFESASCEHMIRHDTFNDFWRRINLASDEKLRTLRY